MINNNIATTDAELHHKKKTNKRNGCAFFIWAQLLTQLSITVAITVYTIIQNNRDQSIAQANRQQDIYLANEMRNKDHDIAQENRLNDILIAYDHQRENILIEYQNFVSDLLNKYGITLNDSAARFVSRFKTLAALQQLNPARRTFLIRSLIEAKLVTYNDNLTPSLVSPIIQLATANLSEIDLSETSDSAFVSQLASCLAFDSTILNRALFRRKHLTGSTFIDAKLNYADFSSSIIGFLNECSNQRITAKISVSFKDADMSYVNFYKAFIDNVEFIFARMIGANMTNTIFGHEINFAHTILAESNFYMAQFTDGRFVFYRANMTSFNGTRAIFNKCSFYETLLFNCSLIYSIINQSSFTAANMTNCQLNNAQLTNVDFRRANLNNVDMSNIICVANCSFSGTNLTGAILHNATIMSSNLLTATFTDQQLGQTRTLAGSTLPNGTVVPMT
ncbi:unnamed protein product [Rotaria sp. Silwood2]|nr:unnamed protein product [Rotaria sp. Silwood2]CAF4096377.1 unnamed protein product [Rotaria sp. Silwood2]